MRRKRILAGLLLAAMLAAVTVCGQAELRLNETKKGGKVVRREWLDESGALTNGPEGYAYVIRSFSGTTVTEKFYDAEGNPATLAGGYAGQMLTYGNRHRLEEIVYLDEKGKKTECGAGYARLRLTYSGSGKVTSAGYFDARNDSVTVPGLGYAAVRVEYRGSTMTKTTWLDASKKPRDLAAGYAVQIQSVNKSNKVTGIRFEHADGSAAASPEGWASCRRELDKKNREVSVKYYDLAGNLMPVGGSYAYEVKTWSGDQAYTLDRYDATGQRVPAGDGYASLKREYNKNDQLIRETCLDASGRVCEDATGVAVRSYGYDGEGRFSEVRYEDERGNAALNRMGCAGYTEKLDGDGFRISRVFFGTDGKPVNTADGYSEIRFLYDGSRRIAKTEYYDVNGALIRAE